MRMQWKDSMKHDPPTDFLKSVGAEGNKETPAFLFLLSKLPQTNLPKDLYACAEMTLLAKPRRWRCRKYASAASSSDTGEGVLLG
jgi:hypothetical protein